MDYRPATNDEILASFAKELRFGWKVRFRHFTLEAYSPRARNGVQHRTRSQSKLRVIDGAPFVVHHGKLQPIAGTAWDLDGRAIVFDLRIKSDYLP